MEEIQSQQGSEEFSKRIYQALKQARTQLEEIQRQKDEPIAIVGMGCRFSGGVKDPFSFWQLLKNGVDCIGEIPTERWDIKDYYDPDPDVPGKMYTRQGGFIEEVDLFDPQFFGISPREAIAMDPQQRLLLEVSWEALEHSGFSPEQLQGSQTGIFMGICFEDYSRFSVNSGNPSKMDAYNSLGNTRSIAAGRLAYVLGFNGPAFFLDTSCSSSLLSVHLACQNLRLGECNLALAGGVNLMLTPEATIGFCKLKALSADGRCKTFDASADGYGRGEGCGVVTLKRLSDAVADGDNIFALIRGSAVNHDGKSNGLTAPNGLAQEALIEQALKNAKVKPSQIDYIEVHGTGTSLGDPIEVLALGEVFGQQREENRPLKIGSVKTNFGHLEAAAGIAGLMKVVLGLEHQQIPPHLHFKQPNPHIPWQKLPIRVPTQLTPWEPTETGRLAGISSFGMSGTNVHIILEEAPCKDKGHSRSVSVGHKSKVKGEDFNQRSHHILTLSAKSEPALKELVQKYEEFLRNDSNASIEDICFTANTGRSHFDHRLAIVASDKQELIDKLASISVQEEINGVFKGQICTNYKLPKIAFLFTGQGSQYIDMGRQLYETQPVFRQVLEQCDKILKTYLNKSILDIVYPEKNQALDNSIINQTAYTQVALFALEYALYQLWESWGIKPSVVMGHSLGEYVAATVAGVFSLEDGLKLIAHRGRLMQQLPTGGEMLSIMASYEQVNQLITPYSDKVAIAAINGPQSVVISGESEAIAKVKEILHSLEIKTKQLQVSHAFHSHLMEPMLAEFAQLASEINYNQPNIPLISNVTGNRADESIATASYWVNHVRQPVKFAQSMETLHQEGCQIFLEIGAKPILVGMGREYLIDIKKLWLPSLRTSKPDWQQILQSLGKLYVQGIQVDWLGFDKNYSYKKVVLPTYPWQRKRYWITDIQQKSNDDKNMSINQVNKEKTISHKEKLRLSNPASLSFPTNSSCIDKTTKRELANLTVQSIQVEESFQVTQQHKTKELKNMSREQIEQLKEEYENKGYCQIKNFFNYSEIKTIQQTLENAKNESHISKEKVTLKLAKNDYIDTSDHAYDLVKYDFVYSLIKNKLSILNYITGKKIVIMHNALFSVEPNQTGLPWHVGVGSFSFTETQDFGASIWIPLDEITKEYRGGMQYVSTKIFPGQFYYTINDLHLKNNLKWDESKGDLNQYVANANTILNNITEDVLDYTIQDGYEEHEYNVGDVLFFNKYVLHRSVPLKPGLHKLRRAFVIRLVDYDTRVDEERLGLFAKYSQLHSRVYKTLPRYNKDSVLVMVSRAIKQGLKSPYLRDIPYVKKTLLERIAVESEKNTETSSLSKLDNLDINSENIIPENISRQNNLDIDFNEIKETLKQSLAEALYTDVSEIKEEQKFIDLGLDSIVGVEWINIINKIYNLNIKATKLYDYPNLVQLTEYIFQNIPNKAENIQVNYQQSSQIENSINNNNYQSLAKLENLQLSNNFQISLLEVKKVLKQKLAEVLYTDISEIKEEQKFTDLGLDSIVGVEWINIINKTYGLNIKATKLYDYPTLLDLSEYITEEIYSKNRNELSPENQHSLEKSLVNQDLSKKSPEDIRQKIRPILNKVANHELTIQEAKKIIQEIKQQSKAKNDSQEFDIKNNSIFELIKKYIYEIVPELVKVSIKPNDSLKNLGIDSVNRAEIIVMVMEELDLHIPLIELAGAKNIGEVANLFAAKLETNNGI